MAQSRKKKEGGKHRVVSHKAWIEARKIVPKGRDEDGLEFTQSWVRYHDRYEL